MREEGSTIAFRPPFRAEEIEHLAVKRGCATLRSRVPEIASAFDQGAITRTCGLELTHVKPVRQKEIPMAMKGYKDYSVAFARSLILKAPPAPREVRRRKRNPWNKSTQRESDLLKKLAEAEQKHDFYSRLYKQYTIDLLRLAIYARAPARLRPSV